MRKYIIKVGKVLLISGALISVPTSSQSEMVAEVAEINNSTTIGKLYHTLAEKKKPSGIELMDGVSMGILVEVEGAYTKQGSESSSDIVLGTFGMGIDAVLQDGIEGHIYLLWEDGDDAVDIDEAYIKLGNSEDIPIYAQAGRMYMPFGTYHSHFVSDPITLELGESRKDAILLGYENDLIQISAGAFNGEFNNHSDNNINDFIAALTLTPVEGLEFGIYWTSDIGEAGGMEDVIHEHINATDEHAAIDYESVNGYGGFIHFAKGIFSMDVEYIEAADNFSSGILEDVAVAPKAWNAELSFEVPHNIELAGRIEGSDEFVNMPEQQYGIAGTYGLSDNVVITVEYLLGKFVGNIEDRNMVTAQLGMEF